MIAAESSTSIARPAAEVFEFVSDVRNDPRWHTDILEAHLTGEGPIGQGSIFVVKFKPFMGHSEGTLSVAKYEPPRRLELQGQMGKMAPTLTPASIHKVTVRASRVGSRWSCPGSCGSWLPS